MTETGMSERAALAERFRSASIIDDPEEVDAPFCWVEMTPAERDMVAALLDAPSPKAVPVAWRFKYDASGPWLYNSERMGDPKITCEPLYAHPPASPPSPPDAAMREAIRTICIEEMRKHIGTDDKTYNAIKNVEGRLIAALAAQPAAVHKADGTTHYHGPALKGDEALKAFASGLASKQEPLPEQAAKVLHDNLPNLYMRSDAPPAPSAGSREEIERLRSENRCLQWRIMCQRNELARLNERLALSARSAPGEDNQSGASAGPSTLAVAGSTTDAASRRGGPDIPPDWKQDQAETSRIAPRPSASGTEREALADRLEARANNHIAVRDQVRTETGSSNVVSAYRKYDADLDLAAAAALRSAPEPQGDDSDMIGLTCVHGVTYSHDPVNVCVCHTSFEKMRRQRPVAESGVTDEMVDIGAEAAILRDHGNLARQNFGDNFDELLEAYRSDARTILEAVFGPPSPVGKEER